MKIEISNGELLDKYTILTIKSQRVTDITKLDIIMAELENFSIAVELLKMKFPAVGAAITELQLVNETLWDIENAIRGKEVIQEFDEQFIILARSVYFNNDKRAHINSIINEMTNSTGEVKQYTTYTA